MPVFKHAVVGSIPGTFSEATVMLPSAEHIDVGLARVQHQTYVRALANAGLEISQLPPDDTHPDCVFVEDPVLLIGGTALLASLGTPSRRGEERALERFLLSRPGVRIETMTLPDSLEGGDCMRVGRRIFVGASSRTNEGGLRRVREVFQPAGYDVIAVPVERHLHLKCFCSPLDDERILLAEGVVPPEAFRGARVIMTPSEELFAANCVTVGRVALIADGYPQTKQILEREGFDVVPLSVSEIQKADGSLTCLSVLS